MNEPRHSLPATPSPAHRGAAQRALAVAGIALGSLLAIPALAASRPSPTRGAFPVITPRLAPPAHALLRFESGPLAPLGADRIRISDAEAVFHVSWSGRSVGTINLRLRRRCGPDDFPDTGRFCLALKLTGAVPVPANRLKRMLGARLAERNADLARGLVLAAPPLERPNKGTTVNLPAPKFLALGPVAMDGLGLVLTFFGLVWVALLLGWLLRTRGQTGRAPSDPQ